MPNYRISDETHRRLQRWAVPLSDSRNEVIQRVLDVAEGKAVEVENLHFHSRSRLAAATPCWNLALLLPCLTRWDR